MNVQGYECSSDLRYVLFRHNVKPVSSLKHGSLAGKVSRATAASQVSDLWLIDGVPACNTTGRNLVAVRRRLSAIENASTFSAMSSLPYDDSLYFVPCTDAQLFAGLSQHLHRSLHRLRCHERVSDRKSTNVFTLHIQPCYLAEALFAHFLPF